MKRCPECGREYDNTMMFCLDDGAELLYGPATASSGDEPATAIIDADIHAQTPAHLKAETAKYSDGDLNKAARPLKTRPIWILGAAAGAIAAAALGYLAYLYTGSVKPSATTRSLDSIKVERLTGDGKARATAISPDGKFIAYARIEGEQESLLIKQIETNSTIEALKPGLFSDIYDLTFSPDGNYVYFNSISAAKAVPEIYKVGTLGGSPTPVMENAFGLRFSPKGDQVGFIRFDPNTTETSIYVSKPDGTGLRKVTSVSGKKFIDEFVAWSPDGTEIAYVLGDDDRLPGPDLSVSIVSASTGQSHEVGSMRWAGVAGIVWHPSDNVVYLNAAETGGAPFQIWELDVRGGEAARLTQNRSSYRGLAITADGKSLISREIEVRSGVWVSPNTDPTKAVEVFPPRGDTGSLDWTPDGRIVFISDQSGADELWIMDADGTNQRQITNDRSVKREPSVSPDGTQVYYFSPKAGGQIFRAPVAGGDPIQVTRGLSSANAHVSPDGQWVIFSAWGDGSTSIYRIPTSGGEAQRLTSLRSIDPRYSPDGRFFAAIIIGDGETIARTIGIFNADGGEPVKTIKLPTNFNSDRGLVWSPDGKAITYLRSVGDTGDMWMVPVEGGEPKRMTDFGPKQLARRAYSRDGKRIAITRGESLQNVIRIRNFH